MRKVLIAVFLIAGANWLYADPETTARLRDHLAARGVAVENMVVTDVDGILVVRGNASASVVDAVRNVGQELGFNRVVVAVRSVPSADEKIEETAERRLSESRLFDDCRFSVEAIDGIVVIRGAMPREIQRDAAVEMLRGIKGVRGVKTDWQPVEKQLRRRRPDTSR